MPALRASHLQSRRRDTALIDLVGSFTRLALDLEHGLWRLSQGSNASRKPDLLAIPISSSTHPPVTPTPPRAPAPAPSAPSQGPGLGGAHKAFAVSPQAAALLLMALGAVLFATMSFFARLASASASWATVAAVRGLLGVLVAYGSARSRGASVTPKSRAKVFWRSLFGTISMLFTFYALSSRTLALGDTVTLLNLTPVFLAVLAPTFLQERTSGAVAVGIAVSFSGVILVVRPSFLFGTVAAGVASGDGPSAALTVATAALGALTASVAMMMLRRAVQTETAEAIAFHFSVFATVTLSAVAAFDLRMPTPRDVAFMCAGGLAGGLAQLAMTRAYMLDQAARVSAMGYLGIVASAALGAIVLGERPGALVIVGMALVIAGGLVITFVRSSGKAPGVTSKS